MKTLARFVRNVVSRSPDRRLSALKTVGDWLLTDYRMSWPQLDWWQDSDFNAYLDRFEERRSFNTQRKWMLWQLLRLTAHVEGDTAECGVFEGASSWLICAANQHRSGNPIHHVFDSFEGLSGPGEKDGTYWKPGTYATAEHVVAGNLQPFAGRFELHKGWIPDRFPAVADRRFSFVHVDVDLYQPTLDCMRFFYDRLSAGGILLCDDYGWSTCPGATQAVDEFLRDKPEKMIALDGGGGFFMKSVQTGAPLRAVG